MMEEMTKDLLKFMVIWILVLITFTCVGTLIFGSLKAFQDLFGVFILFFEAALGNWSISIYSEAMFESEEGIAEISPFV